jgi:NAD(P)-dependent dehydrogenase (short-subunit alcohol dehydrogenase family)
MTPDKHEQYNKPLRAIFTGITDLFRERQKVGELAASDRLDGKKVLITGASSGLGYAVARQLAGRGATVIMACRSGIPEKGEEIRLATGSGNVSMLYVDLSDTDSIRNLVMQIKEQYGTLDIVICNAAVVPRGSRRTRQGFEEMFMVNYLSKFLFINLLLKEKIIRLKGDPLPRIIFVSSESHRNPRTFDWDGFGKYQPFRMNKTVELYGYYKLLLTTFASELSRRLNPEGRIQCSVFALCPGPINSNIAREAPTAVRPLLKIIFSLFFRSPDKAAEPVVYLAVSPALEGKASEYLFLMSRREVDQKAAGPSSGLRLWNLSEELLGINS